MLCKDRGKWQNFDNILLLPESGECITDSLRVETNDKLRLNTLCIINTNYLFSIKQDTFRMYGAKADRQLFLFEKCLLITKKAEDGILACKHCIEVCVFVLCMCFFCSYNYNLTATIRDF